ncbi:MAG TPA: glycosyltransferase family 9 protein [Candidatus Krumholzibacteria bacterium]|nr:glycosyltransferase family 9 protein [Candidatus Krumholzibacteria bacterium]
MSTRDEWLLAVRLRQLGDVLASLEVLRALKAHRPERRIAFVVNGPYAPLVEHEPYIDRVLVPPEGGLNAWLHFLREVRSLHPSAAIDLHGSARSALITRVSGAPLRAGFDVRGRRRAYNVVEPRGEFNADGRRIPHNPITWGARLARHAGCGITNTRPPAIKAGEIARDSVRTRLIEAGVGLAAVESRNLVALNPGRAVPTKYWDPSRFIDLGRSLRHEGRDVIVFWGPGEESNAEMIAREAGALCAPSLSLVEMCAALRFCAALVTIDSGLKHLAVCARTPTVTVFGSTDPREWHMGDEHDIALWKGLSCSPCRRLDCPMGVPCMGIDTAAVLDALKHALGAAS